jgi:hypothetical protein
MAMKNISWLLMLIFVIVLVIAGNTLLKGLRETFQPMVQLRDDLATQVSKFLHPTPTIVPDPVTIVREVRELARLETIQYTVEKVIIAETGQGPFGFLFGDRLLLVAHGMAIAGVDLGQLGPDDIWIDDRGRVYLLIPEPELFVVTLDNEQSYVYDRDTGLLTHGDVNLESTARQAAEEEIRKAALEDGILEQARVNAENYLYRMMRSLGFPDVIFAEEGDQRKPTQTVTPIPLVTPTPSN